MFLTYVRYCAVYIIARDKMFTILRIKCSPRIFFLHIFFRKEAIHGIGKNFNEFVFALTFIDIGNSNTI